MYGLISKMITVPGQRDALSAILLGGVSGMPGCLSYVVAKDRVDANAIWITEVWDSEQSHRAALSLPAVQGAIARGRPLIAGFGDRARGRSRPRAHHDQTSRIARHSTGAGAPCSVAAGSPLALGLPQQPGPTARTR
jgi:quinol monooxygenase YgiN